MVGKDSSLADTGSSDVGSWIDGVSFGNGQQLSVADAPADVYVVVSGGRSEMVLFGEGARGGVVQTPPPRNPPTNTHLHHTIQALYLSTMTIATVGYGDISATNITETGE